MLKDLGVSLTDGVAVLITTVAIAIVLLFLLRLLGQRSLLRTSTFDVVILLVLGSAGGRVLTGYTPTLAAGIIAMATLVLLSWVTQLMARTRLGRALVNDRPILLVDGSTVLHENLKRARVAEDQLWEALRSGGIRNLSEIAIVVLEGTGTISIVKRGAPLDPRLTAGLGVGDSSAR